MTGGAMRHALAVLAPLLIGTPAQSAEVAAEVVEDVALPDTFAARVEALASMASLDAAILGSRSATATLEAWCADHAMAAEPHVRALRVAGPEQPASDERRRRLKVDSTEPVRHRRVRLACGTRVLSEADNWYVPSRLTAAMNGLLETGDTPFGKVVAPLKPTRQTLGSTVLWQVLPAGWELHRQQDRHDDHPERRLAVPPVLFEHRAVLLDGEHHPIAEVEEHYLRAILAFGPPR